MKKLVLGLILLLGTVTAQAFVVTTTVTRFSWYPKVSVYCWTHIYTTITYDDVTYKPTSISSSYSIDCHDLPKPFTVSNTITSDQNGNISAFTWGLYSPSDDDYLYEAANDPDNMAALISAANVGLHSYLGY